MDASSLSSNLGHDSEAKDLKELLDAFGSSFSLEEIASAYCRAGRDVCVTGEMLFGKSGQCSSSNGNPSLENGYKKPTPMQKSSKSKPRRASFSVGSVSSVLGKGYSRVNAPSNGPNQSTKPPKLESSDPLVNQLFGSADALDFSQKNQTLKNKDIENFLFSMLGDGFQLQMDVILDVLGSCGYDAKKSMNKLLSMSNNSVDKVYETKESADLHLQQTQPAERAKVKSSSLDHGKAECAMDILKAWYNVIPESSDEECTKRSTTRRRAAFRTVVSGSVDEIHAEEIPEIVKVQLHEADEDGGNEYQILRKAAKENWDAMKAYYETSVDAFLNHDHSQANYLLEQGKLHHKMAREALEKSTELIHETRNSIKGIILRLHLLRKKEAIRLLKLYLQTYAGISTIQFLKVILENDGEDVMKSTVGRLVLKLLEKESIGWTEVEGHAGTILIKIQEIDVRNLSFAKMS